MEDSVFHQAWAPRVVFTLHMRAPSRAQGVAEKYSSVQYGTEASHEAEAKANQTDKQSATRHKGVGGRAKFFSAHTSQRLHRKIKD